VRVYRSLDDVTDRGGRVRFVAIGFFDGVHRGHQTIIRRAVAAAEEAGGLSTVLTFEPHPNAVLHPERAPRILTPLELKVELIAALGVRELLVVPFDLPFSRHSPLDFCRLVLSDRLGARRIMVGSNFHFGFRGGGTAHDLSDYGRDHGFSVETVSLLAQNGGAISSTRIRDLIGEGDVHGASGLLGRPHLLTGRVVRGAGRGRGLGMPTANLAPEHEVVAPAPGVYVSRSTFGKDVPRDQGHPSVTSVGTNPTFEVGGAVRVETHVLGFQGFLYGQEMSLEFLARLREQRTFASPEELIVQMNADVEAARSYFTRSSNQWYSVGRQT